MLRMLRSRTVNPLAKAADQPENVNETQRESYRDRQRDKSSQSITLPISPAQCADRVCHPRFDPTKRRIARNKPVDGFDVMDGDGVDFTRPGLTPPLPGRVIGGSTPTMVNVLNSEGVMLPLARKKAMLDRLHHGIEAALRNTLHTGSPVTRDASAKVINLEELVTGRA